MGNCCATRDLCQFSVNAEPTSNNNGIVRVASGDSVPCAEEKAIDIVLVHGWNGSPIKTWTDKDGVCWPKEILPLLLNGRANVYTYGYESAFTCGDDLAATTLKELSNNFLEQLLSSEVGKNRLLLFVGHSLGGVLIKGALNMCKSSSNLERTQILQRICGIVFIATPHRGSSLASCGACIMPCILHSTGLQLAFDETIICDIHRSFVEDVLCDITDKTKVYCFFEMMKTTSCGCCCGKVVVKPDEATILGVGRCGIELDHLEISRPSHKTNRNNLRTLINKIQTITDMKTTSKEELDEVIDNLQVRGDELQVSPSKDSVSTSSSSLSPRTPPTADSSGRDSPNSQDQSLVGRNLEDSGSLNV